MAGAAFFAASWPAGAQTAPDVTRTTFGDVGLLEMPSARMAPDGQLSLTVGALEGTQRYNLAFQILPWLEGSFRYSHIAHWESNGAFLYDRSLGFKLRLLKESEYIPEVSLGLRDILGTGAYASEYIVASKSLGDFDLTAGMGWGRLASRPAFANPLALIFPSFKSRASQTTSGTGGSVDFGSFFHGPDVGVFGGASWRTPIEGLDLLVEYSSDKYVIESAAAGGFRTKMPINLGMSYRPLESLSVTAGWYYGTSYGLTVSFHTDPTVSNVGGRIAEPLPAPVIRSDAQQVAALTNLLKPSPIKIDTQVAVPWVSLPQPAADPRQHVLASLMTVASGIRDVEIDGDTLVVDASAQGAGAPCASYARVLAASELRVKTVAISDLRDGDGRTSFCAIPMQDKFISEQSLADASVDSRTDAVTDTMGLVAPGDIDAGTATAKIRADLEKQSIGIEAISVEPAMIWLYFSNSHYASETEAAGRIARILMADAPSKVEVFHIVSVRNGVQLRDFQVARSALERATQTYAASEELAGAVSVLPAPLSNPVLERAWEDSYPRFHWSFGPGIREGLFDPSRPLQVQILAAANASIDITHNLTFEGRVEANIYNNYNFDQLADSLLPHVRSDVTQYLRHGINGIANLDAVYRMRLSRDVYFEAKAGYLEDMFMGGGVQVLWRPEGERFSFGVDLYEVWQRDFNRLFGAQNYHVLTGHASVYYESPWYGLNFAVHAGRYLAGDYGATVEITRRFSTGVEVGAFATFTNVPFAKFGEGSFDKGIIVHVPLEWALPFFSQSSYDLLLRSLIRDGGQRLYDDNSLYGETRPTSYGEVIGHIDEITMP